MRGKWFSERELVCKCGCETNHVKQELVDKLDELRERLGKPVHLNSVYRCENHLEERSKSKPGYHNKGIAADIKAYPSEVAEIVKHAYDLGFKGFGYSKGFVHIDLREQPAGWFY